MDFEASRFDVAMESALCFDDEEAASCDVSDYGALDFDLSSFNISLDGARSTYDDQAVSDDLPFEFAFNSKVTG